MVFIVGVQWWFNTNINKCNISHQQDKEEQLYNHLNGGWKSIWSNPTFMHDLNIEQIRYRGNMTQYNKDHICQSHGQYHFEWVNTGNACYRIWSQTMMSSLTTFILRSTGSFSLNNLAIKKQNGFRLGRKKSNSSCLKTIWFYK